MAGITQATLDEQLAAAEGDPSKPKSSWRAEAAAREEAALKARRRLARPAPRAPARHTLPLRWCTGGARRPACTVEAAAPLSPGRVARHVSGALPRATKKK